jgi:hypothetical protein
MTSRAHGPKTEAAIASPAPTGWPPSELMQDDCKKLSQWLSNRVDSRMHAREAAQAISSLPAIQPHSLQCAGRGVPVSQSVNLAGRFSSEFVSRVHELNCLARA